MRLFFKESKENIEKSKMLATKLKNLNPELNKEGIEKVKGKILETHSVLETSIKLRDYHRAYDLRNSLEQLYGKKEDLEKQVWQEKDRLIFELREVNEKVVSYCSEWLTREIAELDRLRNIVEVSRKQNARTLEIKFTVKTNFRKIKEAQDLLIETKKQIRNMAAVASIGEIEALYLKSISELPSGEVECTDEVIMDEQDYFELKETIGTNISKSDSDTLITYHKAGGLM